MSQILAHYTTMVRDDQTPQPPDDDDDDDLSDMLDGAPTTPPNMYGEE